ncbi:hypothetical protein EO98_01700 [Methanosarcina sp. 2.H.T.1A.6]|uniref:hypothetical protein n=1 Tax=unclassified Methanosarcina TaxID=2644672 RepID=UPI000620E8E8|nr:MULTISPECIES: hypothetical protein [unclassified Methanosarcina]KKG18247.1 hypothetical protein EO94_07880 [Methanosarcina sp. 2.H.T.1A.3]KKG21106.1 hypothetical protein EO98_01700 [Methanosarcina sp. 2.H.T.1A.6]KKG21615.1 hypothetical protein EO97_02460 [Methanosarcina sp. 2.H.T.1A.15]KKG23852.1 hypothetical protein EO96_07410 [Methanosarcina sp. 2.H.T.1A.8]
MQVKNRENVYSSICPGCGLACGLYIREMVSGTGETSVSVDFRKSSPVNAGKLCRFGLKLPVYYTEPQAHTEPQASMVRGQKSELKAAISAASEALKTAPAESLAFFSVGNTTNEEQKAFSALAGAFGAGVETGMGIYSSLPAKMHSALFQGMSLEGLEKAKQVFLFVDPYSQYPLLLRRVIRAKENGAKVVCIGPRHLPVADEQFCLKPEEYEKALSPSRDSVLIADIHPYSDPAHIKAVLDLAQASGAKPFFLRPFANSAGTALLSAHTKQRTLDKLFEDINSGKIKTLFCLESDLLELAPDREAALQALSKLDTLIVQTSGQGEFSGLADILIASEPFYRKHGTVLNAEGRLLSVGGNSTSGFDALSGLAAAFGKQLDFESARKEVFEVIGLKEADEFAFRKPAESFPVTAEVETPCSKHETGQESCSVSNSEVSNSESCPEKSCPECSSASLVYSLSPFMWHGVEDCSAFVELNLSMVRKLGLVKGGNVKIRASGKTVDMKFRISDIENGYLLSPLRLPVSGIPGAEVELSR